jgi:hypothetical protein
MTCVNCMANCQSSILNITMHSKPLKPLWALTSSMALLNARLGHLNHRYKKGLIKLSINLIDNDQDQPCCEGCTLGKYTVRRMKNQPRMGDIDTKVGELFYCDICGPYHNRYMITFIDDYSGFTYVYFIKQKSQTLEKFKEYFKFIETQKEITIKVLKSDLGTEYF